MITAWPLTSGDTEYAVSFDRKRSKRLLVIPALFDEANKTRHLLVEVMRRLDGSGIDAFLPDLPGSNESESPLEQQSLADWRDAARDAASHFEASHVLTVRAGAILPPPALPGWRYAPTTGASALKSMLRARVISSREAGRDENTDSLLAIGRVQGLELAGYRIGQQMIDDLAGAHLPDSGKLLDITQSTVGGGGAWLRAEPGFDPAQADALAAAIAIGMLE